MTEGGSSMARLLACLLVMGCGEGTDQGMSDGGSGADSTGADSTGADGSGSDGSSGACLAWPDATSTGPPAGTTLTAQVGDLQADTAGQIIEGVDVNGAILCTAPNVTIRNSRLTGGILADTGCTGLRVDHVEIDCQDQVGSSGFVQNNGFVGQDIELGHMNIHRCENGVFIDNGVAVHDSWIHEPIMPGDTVTGAHSDGIQLWASASDVVIECNVIAYEGDTTSGIISACDTGLEPAVHDIKIDGNKLAGGGYTLYLPNQAGPGACSYTNVRVTNNRFGDHAFGYCTGSVEELTEFSGNVVDATGEPITGC